MKSIGDKMKIYFKEQSITELRNLLKQKLADDEVDFIVCSHMEYFCLRRDLAYPKIQYQDDEDGKFVREYFNYGDIQIYKSGGWSMDR